MTAIEAVQRRRRLIEAGAVALVLLVALAVRAPSVKQPLLESHPFRQTQTALTAKLFHEDGIDLLHPKLPLFGEADEAPFEFPLFQAIASVPMALGVSPDTSMRLTSLAFFVMSALLLYGVTRRLAGAAAALVALAAFSFSPLSLLWSRAALIEYLAIAGALGWLWGAMAWRDGRNWWAASGALVAGTVGMLVKPTTAAFWVLPILAYRAVDDQPGGWRQFLRSRMDLVLLVLLGVPVLAAALWTRHADAVKAAQEATSWLTSSSLREWNFGTLEQRRELGTWRVIGDRVRVFGVGLALWQLPLVIGLGMVLRQRMAAAAVAASAFLTVAVFFNLYWVHDYYLTALTPQFAMAAGFAAAGGMALARRAETRALIAGAAAVWVLAMAVNGYGYWKVIYLDRADFAGRLAQADELAAATAPGERVVFEGFDWEPVMPYYSQRYGLMLTPHVIDNGVLDALPPQGYRALLTQGYGANTGRALGHWPWISAASERVYRLGTDPSALAPARVLSTSDVGRMPSSSATPPTTLQCNGPSVAVPTKSRWTWLRFEGDHGQGLVVEEAGPAAYPANRLLLAAPGLTGRQQPLHVRCVGGGIVRLVAVADADGP